MYDAIIIGGGTAGLSAALVLGRARRSVLVLDGGPPRNAPAAAAHGFFTRDGTPPLDLLAIGREQLQPYATVTIQQALATGAVPERDGFLVETSTGDRLHARRLILATGVIDELPAIPGTRELWGRWIHHCPYCHGWEVRDQPLGVYASGEAAMHFAPLIRNWSRSIVLLSDGPDGLSDAQRATLRHLEIEVRDEPIARFEASDGGLGQVVFVGGATLALRGVFARTASRPRNDLARALGCAIVADGPVPGLVQVNERYETTVPGVYAVGDLAIPLQQVILAAASGAVAAAILNNALVSDTVQAVAR